MVWELAPNEIQDGSYLVHANGKKLQNGQSESIRGFSLCPLYSHKQLRKIHRIRKEKANNVNRNSNGDAVKTQNKNKLRTTDAEGVYQ